MFMEIFWRHIFGIVLYKMQQIWFDAAVVSQSLGCRQDVFVAFSARC